MGRSHPEFAGGNHRDWNGQQSAESVWVSIPECDDYDLFHDGIEPIYAGGTDMGHEAHALGCDTNMGHDAVNHDVCFQTEVMDCCPAMQVLLDEVTPE